MTDALSILQQRLASGAISEEEYDRLRAKLAPPDAAEGRAASPPEQATFNVAPPPPPPVKQKSWLAKNWWWLAVLGGVISVVANIGQASAGLTVGDIQASGSRITFKVSNSSNKSEDFLFWVKQDDIEKCPHKTAIRAGYTHTITFSCPNMSAGRFSLMSGWASSDRGKANIATRVD